MPAGHVETLQRAAGYRLRTERVFAYEKPCGKRSFLCATGAAICKLIQEKPKEAYWHECLLGQPCDSYVDIDIGKGAGVGVEEAEAVLQAVVGGMSRMLGAVNGESVVSVYSSCGEGKYSWHVVGRHESAMCKDTRIAWMMTVAIMQLAGGDGGDWFGAEKGKDGKQCFIDLGVYAHGFLRTSGSRKRNSTRVKRPVGDSRGGVGMGAGGEAHLVGEPSDFGGSFWDEADVGAMCRAAGFEYELAVARWETIWKLQTGQRLPRMTKRVVMGTTICADPSCGLPNGTEGLLLGLVGALGEEFKPGAPAAWAMQQGRTRVLRFRTAIRYCPFAGRRHSSNNVYVNVQVDMRPMTYKIFCTSVACKEKVANAGYCVVPLAVAVVFNEARLPLSNGHEQ